MNLEKGTSYQHIVMGWFWLLVAVGVVSVFVSNIAVKTLMVLIMLAGAVFPLYLQLKSKRRLNWVWVLCEHLEENSFKYKASIMVNVLVLLWFIIAGIYFLAQ